MGVAASEVQTENRKRFIAPSIDSLHPFKRMHYSEGIADELNL